jgi:Ca2+-transporting ATPase
MKLNKKKDDRMIKVIRSGKTMKVSVYECFVGDVMILEQGDVLPVDGIYIDGYNVSCDESSATGESDLMKKTPANEVWRAIQENRELKKMDPFILSGAKVSEGVGSFLVTAVGIHSSYGKTMMALREDNEVTPLQYKLNILAGKSVHHSSLRNVFPTYYVCTFHGIAVGDGKAGTHPCIHLQLETIY